MIKNILQDIGGIGLYGVVSLCLFFSVFTSALITYLVTGKNVDEAAILGLIELLPAEKCPGQFMLAQAFPGSCIRMFTKVIATAIDD